MLKEREIDRLAFSTLGAKRLAAKRFGANRLGTKRPDISEMIMVLLGRGNHAAVTDFVHY